MKSRNVYVCASSLLTIIGAETGAAAATVATAGCSLSRGEAALPAKAMGEPGPGPEGSGEALSSRMRVTSSALSAELAGLAGDEALSPRRHARSSALSAELAGLADGCRL